MSQINVITRKCRRCYSCIQICPAKAIKREKGNIKIIHERCILCGSCIKACPQGALFYTGGLNQVKEFLNTNEQVVACLDPAFPGVLDVGTPRQLVTALKKVGFTEVWEGAFGAELVSREYRQLLDQGEIRPIISSFCPAIVFYIQKYLSQLIPNLAPIVSPMIAIGRVVRKLKGPDWKVVYITSCLAQMGESDAPEVAGSIDQVITLLEAKQLLDEAGINRQEQVETNFDGPRPYLGRIIPVIGGLYRCMGESFDVLMDEISVTGGRVRSLRALNQLVAGHIDAKFLDIVFCEGCVDGPFVDIDIFVLGRRQNVARYTKNEMSQQNPADLLVEMMKFKNVELRREFQDMKQQLTIPTEEQIQTILKAMDKAPPDRNLDCRACGYRTCREKAIAIVQGQAELEMCLPYLLERTRKIYHQLKKSHQVLQISHRELENAQAHLIRTEKLASLGQLAAGVAHEINNPLGTITIFAHLLLKNLADDDPRREDIKMIIDEASRTKEIVQGLLSFARETKLRPGLTDINELIEDVLNLVINQSLFYNINIQKQLAQGLPSSFADGTQLKQVFFNIILNAAQAMKGQGDLYVITEVAANNQSITIKIKDTGPGIPDNVMGKLFDPFFTTKEKGTGLGLAISYGVVERHLGKIDVKTEIGKGSTFNITLPILTDETKLKKETIVDDIIIDTKEGVMA
jgi:two-component system NtrC family sensor kinase